MTKLRKGSPFSFCAHKQAWSYNTQTCAHPPSIYVSSLNLEDLDEYLDETMNLESSFKEIPPPTPNLFDRYFSI